MRNFQRLPVAMQTVYAELVDRAWLGSFREIMDAGGTPHRRTVKGAGLLILASRDPQRASTFGQVSGAGHA